MGRNLRVRGERCERGESLAEVVCALAIIGFAVVGLVAALGTTFAFAKTGRVGARGDLLLVRYAEALAAVPYEACHAGATPYQSAAAAAIPSSGLPAGVTAGPWGSGDGSPQSYELEIESVGYWNADTNPASFAASCGANDRGAQQLVLRARSADGAFDRRLAITKRSA